jgi:hypothetical protein
VFLWYTGRRRETKGGRIGKGSEGDIADCPESIVCTRREGFLFFNISVGGVKVLWDGF